LDLSYSYPDAQASLFSRNDWSKLRYAYNSNQDTKRDLDINRKAEKTLEDAAKISSTSLPDASDHIYRHLYKNKKKLTSNEEFILFSFAFILEFIDCNQYIFDSNIKKNEQDCIVKLWGPLFEKLVQRTTLRLKW
jgi:hypothetical protein